MLPREFVHTSHPQRVVFGVGSMSRLVQELDLLGVARVLVLCTPQQRGEAESVADLLGARAADIFDQAVMHVPIESAREARALARRLGADCAVAIGGGSTTGLGKAIALDTGLPIVAIPTTYAGSEMTPIYGFTEDGIKKTGRDWRVLPRTVLYDPALTLELPVAMSVTSGINAIAHAAEGLYAQDASPIASLMALEGIAALGRALPAIRRDARDVDARGDALYGAWLCGSVLSQVGMALHHKLCHTLGGSFNLPHAETHTVVLPHALAYNAQAAPVAMRLMAAALGSDDAPAAVHALARDNGAPTSLRELGMVESDLDQAADIASLNPYWNPRPIDRAGLRALLQMAFEGAPPASISG